MGEFSNNKFKKMVDEMNRFEEEIKIEKHKTSNSQSFVLGTNTFNQAQQNLRQNNVPNTEARMFIPNQVLSRHQSLNTQGPVPPPPAPPLAVSGFSARPSAPFSQPIPPPPQPPSFASTAATSSALAAARRPPSPWVTQSNFTLVSATTEKKSDTNPDGIPKVVLSATPKLYTPKTEQYDYSTPVPNHTPAEHHPKPEHHKHSSKKQDYIKKDGKQYALHSVSPYDTICKKKDKKSRKCIRVSGGQVWEDPTLGEWEDGDFRLFCGDLGNDVTDELLTRIFSRYPSFVKARVVRDKRTNKTKGFGFISFKDPQDFIKASKEMNGRYVGSRPIKLRKSTWKNRNLDTVRKKEKEKQALIAALMGQK